MITPALTKALVGYSIATGTTKMDLSFLDGFIMEGEVKYKGFIVGAKGDYSPTEKLSLSATVVLGPEMKRSEEAKTNSDSESLSLDASLVSYKLTAAYEIKPNIATEIGYTTNNYRFKYEDEDYKEKMGGLSIGLRAFF